VIVGQSGGEILVFEVAGRRFGLPAAAIRELLRAVAVVPLPRATPAVEGVVDLRGRVVPVIDLRARLGLPAREVAPTDHMIVAESAGGPVALRVDRAIDLVRHETEAVSAPGATARVIRLEDGLAPMLDLRSLLDGVDLPETLGAVGDGHTAAEGGSP
jgi:purine-binding chemotaxis protein CheW